MITPFALSSLRRAFGALVWSDPSAQATVYDNDGVSNPRPVLLALDNDAALKSRRTASQFTLAYLPVGSPVVPGIVLHTSSDRWYLAAESSNITSSIQTALVVQVLPLPYAVILTRSAVAPTQGARRTDAYGSPLAAPTGTSHIWACTVRFGYSTDFDQSGNSDGSGRMETGIAVGYVPLGSDVREADVLTLRGQRYNVTNVQVLTTEGTPWALQLEARLLTGGQTP